uniref:Ig-like domain-containing protein n=1 Tax=Amphilophus citrinellus TaxID=61819 RepID=A0A3Q0QTQ7_AMPCI
LYVQLVKLYLTKPLVMGMCVLIGRFLENQKTITAESGQNVTLTCRGPNNNIHIVEWSKADLGKQCVLMQRDGHFVPDYQHPSFKNRVDLQDRQMKDGDVSVILKNVTINDGGTYECRVKTGAKRRSRALLKTAPINIINLRVAAPPGELNKSVLIVVNTSINRSTT